MTHRPLRVLMIGANYPPEPTGNAPYTGALAAALAKGGNHVAVITTHPHYPGWKIREGYGQWSSRSHEDSVSVLRLRHYVPRQPSGTRRAASEISFGFRAALTRWRRPDVILVVSPALMSTAVVLVKARLTNRSTPVVVWVQDLYSVGLAETDQGGTLVRRVFTWLEAAVFRSSHAVVVIHERFAARVARDYGISRSKIAVIRNWTHLPPPPRVDRESVRQLMGWGDEKIIVLHAGNMGRKQGLENVVAAAKIAEATGAPVQFVLMGGGSEKGRLERAAASLSTIQFVDPLPAPEYSAALQAADILLVNEKPGVSEMSVPSKLTSYFSSGTPVLASADPAGITADEVRRAGAGAVVPPGDPEALVEVALRIASDRDSAQKMGMSGLQYRRAVLDEAQAVQGFTTVLRGLAGRPSERFKA